MYSGRRSSWKAVAVLLLVVGVGLGAASSCGGDDGACSLDDNEGCETGQVCVAGNDGAAVCADCSTKNNEGCGNGQVCLLDPKGAPACYCGLDTEAGCKNGTVCEEVEGGYPTCFPPVTMGGKVFDLATDKAIAGARVVARDANFAAVTGVAVTDAAGNYTLTVPAARNADGTIRDLEVFLRADASRYLTFPTAPRVALPIQVANATGDPPHLASSATDIGLIELENTEGLGTVSGKVLADVPVGTLVVAGGAQEAGGGATGIADTDGSYTVFNVPAGSVAVRGYKLGLQLAEATAKVTADKETTGVNLASKGTAKAVVSGSINLVNPGDGSITSVILAVDETFVPQAARGEAPPGLRIAPVSNSFRLAGVPDGNYVVLAAFENDFLVRDPDTAIGGTNIVRIQVSGADVSMSESFKVTGSLDVVSPDAEEVVSGTPRFVWSDDSGEDHYEVRVFDAFGNKVWEDLAVPKVTGSSTVEVDYGGPALERGLLYQFRAVSIKNGGTPISITEDLRGVFLYK
jgi:hypothetical protein